VAVSVHRDYQRDRGPGSGVGLRVGSSEMGAPSALELSEVNPNNVGTLRMINTTIFPVKYAEKFYTDAVKLGELARLALLNDVCVGAIASRVDGDGTEEEGPRRLYIMTVGVLAAYRGMGIGRALLQHVLDVAEAGAPGQGKGGPKDSSAQEKEPLAYVSLHVQINNEDARNFYAKFGFSCLGVSKLYYKRLDPPDAWVLAKALTDEGREALDRIRGTLETL